MQLVIGIQPFHFHKNFEFFFYYIYAHLSLFVKWPDMSIKKKKMIHRGARNRLAEAMLFYCQNYCSDIHAKILAQVSRKMNFIMIA